MGVVGEKRELGHGILSAINFWFNISIIFVHRNGTLMPLSRVLVMTALQQIILLLCKCGLLSQNCIIDNTIVDDFPSLCFSNFWKIVREFDETQKKQLLAFVTGSDRIPLGGLAKLKFIIVKNGPDSDRYTL
jgi:hypothetical protein